MFAIALILYISTLAPGVVFGDPAEYTFVPHIWGISHPPGYAFQTVLGGLWQRIVPVGSIAYRANLLSAFAGAGIAALVYGAAYTLAARESGGIPAYISGLVAGLSAATATDIWQHSIHANAHIVTALLASASLFTLLRWWRSGQNGEFDDRWLFAFCVIAGLSVTHHPLLVFSFPAYAVFILVVKPSVVIQPTWKVIFYSPRSLLDGKQWKLLIKNPHLLFNWQTPFKMVVFALIGLSVWLYLPLRASLSKPILFGPHNVNTFDGFLDLVLARGLRVNLFHFGLADQPGRALVFWSLLNLQASLPVIALMLIGLIWIWRQHWRTGLLYTLFLVANLGFILNTIQDVMAYLMIPFAALMALAGVGLIPVFEKIHFPRPSDERIVHAILGLVAIGLPLLRIVNLSEVVSLRHYTEAQDWVTEVYDYFEGSGEGAVLLAHWEHLTPLWYEAWVEDHPLARKDVRLVFVATTSVTPWVDNVRANIDQGPVYVSGYQRELIDAGFRLRPVRRRLYRVLSAPATEIPDMQTMLNAQAGLLTVVGIDLPETKALPGQSVPLSIALSIEDTTTDIIFPYILLGDENAEPTLIDDDLVPRPALTFQFTTDSHWLTPYWQPGEIIVERYDIRLPLSIPPGDYPLRLGLRNLTGGGDSLTFADSSTLLDIGTISVPNVALDARLMSEDPLMADIAHRVGLISAIVHGNGQRRVAIWQEPLSVKPGQDIHVRLRWMALYPPDANWKIYVHLIRSDNTIIAQQDNPPLGGAFPTFLWFPKWVTGQVVDDPYRITIPPDTPPGGYTVEIGLYGFMTLQRAPFFDNVGNLSGDHFILGVVRVE